MLYIIFKYLITAGLVVLITELAKANDKIGALVASLPLVTVLTLIWLYIENQPTDKIANHAYYTFWYVLPTLPMFLLFPFLLKRIDFIPSLAICIVVTALLFYGYAVVLRKLGINLL